MWVSGRRGSNPRPAAWKAAALPTELLPHVFETQHFTPFFGGENRIRTCEDISQQIYSLSSLAAWVSPLLFKYFTERLESRKNRFSAHFPIH